MKWSESFNLRTPKLLMILGGIGGVLFFIGCGNTPEYLKEGGTGQYLKSDLAQDRQIESDISEIRSALLAYAQKEKTFPPSLNSLVPGYLEKIPLDPMTGAAYSYKADLFTGNYELKYKTTDGLEHTADATTTDIKLRDEFSLPQ